MQVLTESRGLRLDEQPEAIQKFYHDAHDVYMELLEVLTTKQIDYSADNINNAYGGPANGLMVRMGDKWERLKNLISTGAAPQHESVEDTLGDLANYCVIFLMLNRNAWPKGNSQ
jgi:hypothetical protein